MNELGAFLAQQTKVYDYHFQVEGTPSPIQPVYGIAHRYLRYSIQNDRYAAERRAKEREPGFAPDRLNPEHQQIIRELPRQENLDWWKSMKADLQEGGSRSQP